MDDDSYASPHSGADIKEKAVDSISHRVEGTSVCPSLDIRELHPITDCEQLTSMKICIRDALVNPRARGVVCHPGEDLRDSRIQ